MFVYSRTNALRYSHTYPSRKSKQQSWPPLSMEWHDWEHKQTHMQSMWLWSKQNIFSWWSAYGLVPQTRSLKEKEHTKKAQGWFYNSKLTINLSWLKSYKNISWKRITVVNNEAVNNNIVLIMQSRTLCLTHNILMLWQVHLLGAN